MENEINTFSIDPYGDITIRSVVFDTNGTDLVEGIEIELEDECKIIKIYGYTDISELTADEVEDLIEQNI